MKTLDHSKREQRLLMAYLLGWTYEEVFLKNPKPESVDGFDELWQQRLSGAPLARLIGSQTFRNLKFHISPHVLEPRPDSELILDVLHQHIGKDSTPRCLDLGTGSGCLIVSILKEWPLATGVGIDISPEALGVASQNAELHHVQDRVAWIQSNWLESLPPQKFDVIVANPPYIGVDEPLDSNVVLYDPHLALYGGKDGLDCYRAILSDLHPYCHDQTLCLFEIGYQQHASITYLLKDWSLHNIYHDDAGHSRVVRFGQKT